MLNLAASAASAKPAVANATVATPQSSAVRFQPRFLIVSPFILGECMAPLDLQEWGFRKSCTCGREIFFRPGQFHCFVVIRDHPREAGGGDDSDEAVDVAGLYDRDDPRAGDGRVADDDLLGGVAVEFGGGLGQRAV